MFKVMQISEYSPYQNFVFALKSKDVKRQYPAMLSRFFDFIQIEKIIMRIIMMKNLMIL
jgi:hypothetical protein